jgi:hypothetical protein
MDNPCALVVRYDAVSRSVRFNDKLIAFAKHWGFAPRACAPYRARTKQDGEWRRLRDEECDRGYSFASWEAFEAHLAEWKREVADVRIHGTTGETPIARFERDEAHRLKPLGGRPSFGSLRELSRVVGNDCAIEIDEQLLRAVADRRTRGGNDRGRRGAHPPRRARDCCP